MSGASTRVPAPEEILARLRPLYGDLPWRPHHDPVSELVLTILSQHTNDTLSGKAFARLLERFPSWGAIADAPADKIEDAIREGGLARQKAPRIKAVLERIAAERGAFDLGFLGDLPLDEAKTWLRSLPGVGPKTAACVLMFALGRPALPVDTHVYRVSRRLGLIGPKVNEAAAHTLLEAAVSPEDTYAFHIALIKHGRYTCTAQRPRCDICPLNDICPSAFSAEPVAGAAARRERGGRS
jgi:endonuclease III